MFGRFTQILIKEFIQLWRDKWGRFRLIVPPVIQLLLFGYAATFEVYHVSTVVLDLDHTQESRDLVARFTSSNRLAIVRRAQTQQEADGMIDRSDAAVALVIHAGFANLLRKGQAAPLQVLVDGTNSNTALIALGYINTIAAQFSQDYTTDLAERTQGIQGLMRQVQVTLVQRPWYNPDFNGRWFFVPGVIATITLVMVVNLTAFAVVREREVGTLEQIMVSPIRPAEFILGKTVPFFVVGMGLAGLVTIVGIVWFQIPFVGNPLVFLLGTTHLYAEPAGARPADLHGLLDPAAGLRHQFLRGQSAVHPVGFQLSDFQHAGIHAVAHLRQSAALLSHRYPRHVS